MCDDIRLAKIATKPRFDNAISKFYHETIRKAVKMKTRLGGEFWACDVIVRKTYYKPLKL